MEYIREKDQKKVKLDKEAKSALANQISDDFRTFDNARNPQLEKAHKLLDEIYFKNNIQTNKNKSKSWKSTLKTRKLFMYSQILKAFIWKNTYANTNGMFDVSGESLEADNNSNKQKTMLVGIMEGMDYAKTCDRIIDDSLVYGELISFNTWRKHSEEIRRPIPANFQEAMEVDINKVAKITEAMMKGQNFYLDERIDYDNPYVYPVDPANFVFDSTQFSNWDYCPKILRTWRTPDDIINNAFFEVSNECKEYIKNLVKDGTNISEASEQREDALKNKEYNGSTVEVLEHWGNLRMKDGTTLHNWYCVVVAGKYVVAFEKNPFVINPFTFGCYVQDPSTMRGVSPLYSIYDLALTQETMLRKTMDLQALAENPPSFVAKDFFGKDPDDIEVHPGKIYEYDNNLYGNAPIDRMEFNTTVFQDSISYVDDLMSEISGVFPNMAGASESERTTATEISTKVEGQLTRLKMLLDVINQYLILENVKKIAKLKANFTFGEEVIYDTNGTEHKEVVINDEVRQAEYKYTYADRSATSERFNFADMVAQSAQMFMKAGTPLNPQEMFTWYMSEKGVENPERFLMTQDVIDPQVQQALLQNPQLAPIIQEMQRRVEMARQGQELPDDTEAPQVQEEGSQDLSSTLNELPGRNLLSNG